MGSNTTNLNLLKKDPITDGDQTFNIETMLNDNWDKIDTGFGDLTEKIESLEPEIPEATTARKGIVQLSSATNSASEMMAATSLAVKSAFDRATTAETNAKNASLPRAGGKITGALNINDQLVLQTNGDVLLRGSSLAPTRLNGTQLEVNIGGSWIPVQTVRTTDGSLAINITGQDLNTIRSTGWYMGSSMTNAPTSEWYWVEIIRHNDAWEVQNAYCFNRHSFYQRIKMNGTFGPWSVDVFQSGVNAKQGIVDAINAKGGSASTAQDWSTLAANVRSIRTGGYTFFWGRSSTAIAMEKVDVSLHQGNSVTTLSTSRGIEMSAQLSAGGGTTVFAVTSIPINFKNLPNMYYSISSISGSVRIVLTADKYSHDPANAYSAMSTSSVGNGRMSTNEPSSAYIKIFFTSGFSNTTSVAIDSMIFL
ncbi:pyocin knob domain-containing protein [Paenibacillus massiliensis]|uniref:pyocin knob domain-containing protein n=1 Tax=Paenibacillus massiliensis TaxID=225917 RepID=UPI00037E28C5|nr:pyocin knob domain-containing protein [Paenibacillus massiliensis]